MLDKINIEDSDMIISQLQSPPSILFHGRRKPALIRVIYITFLICVINFTLADDLVSLFPIGHYDQNISHWIKPGDPDYNKQLISPKYQQKRFAEFINHYYTTNASGQSPWSSEFVAKQMVPDNGKNILDLEFQILTDFYNHDNDPKKIAYGENFRPYAANWYQKIADNMDLEDDTSLRYTAKNRGIAVANLYVRVLPTNDPLFYSHEIAGQGYPFDNLQETALFIGMPLYIIKQTYDKAWTLVITSDVIGWVETAGIARVDNKFIKNWQKSVNKGLVASIKQDSLIGKNGQFRGIAYNGNCFPLIKNNLDNYLVLVPAVDINGYAHSILAKLPKTSAVIMPLALTPHNMAIIMQNQIGKPYGWGNMFFDYDCSAETKALFMPFGIYLPRNSQYQFKSGTKVVQLDQFTAKAREEYLIAKGHKFLTLIQVPGHILLYIGNYANPFSKNYESIAMSYQNIWGLRTKNNNSRSVIGQSVIFPLLTKYPENDEFVSVYDQKSKGKFRLIYLDDE
ncbi:MAG: NlpC-P60 family protein [Burkholderiales bacterium]|jgi:hypothetical protein|nr:NlpC-P60 family protein [Burkholderiales bacterium]